MKKRLLILDFDGVVCNSEKESLFSAYNAYRLLNNNKGITDPNEIDEKIKEKFHRLRPFIKSGRNFFISFWAIENNIYIKDQEQFNELVKQQERETEEYEIILYEERERLVRERRDFWLSLNPLFKAGELIKNVNPNLLYILSTKKKPCLIEILKHNQIGLPGDHVIYSLDKINYIDSLLQQKKASIEDSVFIEDQIEFLIEAEKIGIQRYLAGWGYTNEDQRKKAQENRILVINTEEFEEIIRGFM